MRASHNGAFSIHQNWPANPLALCAIGGRMDFSGLPAQQLRALFFRLADAFKAARPSGLSIRRLPRRCAFNHLNNYSPAEWSCRSAIIIPAERRGRHFESLVKSEEARAAPNCQYNLNNAAVARGKFQLPGRPRGNFSLSRESRNCAGNKLSGGGARFQVGKKFGAPRGHYQAGPGGFERGTCA